MTEAQTDTDSMQRAMGMIATMNNDNVKNAIERLANEVLQILNNVSDRDLTDAEKQIQEMMKSEANSVGRM